MTEVPLSGPLGRPSAIPGAPVPAAARDPLEAVEAELAALDSIAPAEQVGAFDRIHHALTAALATAATDSGTGPLGGSADRTGSDRVGPGR